MNIIIDAMGGDNAPEEIVKGGVSASNELGVTVTLVGQRERINEELAKHVYDLNKVNVLDAASVVYMEDDPTSVIKHKKDSSMCVGLYALADGKGDAFVSAGSTGALVTGATLIAKRIKGVRRVALSVAMPAKDSFYLLIDGGANVECTPDFLAQFASMGSIYMKKVFDIESPAVGLVNIGSEEEKGTETIQKANKILKGTGHINYIGYVEPRDIPAGAADVVVCDGFTGNVILKLVEGVGLTFYQMIKDIFMQNMLSNLAALLVKTGLKDLKKKMDYTEVGGAPLLGCSKPVIKAHGSSNAKAIHNAVKQAVKYVETGVIDEIGKEV